MEPQTVIPLAHTSGELKGIIGTHFKGYVNVLLTPDTVDYLLSINSSNRNVKTPSVNAYAVDFEHTGYESIALMTIDDSGRFSDGQHRLLALKKLFNSGWNPQPIWQLVNLSVSQKRTGSIDNGVVRSATDTLVMHGTVPNLKIARGLKTYALLCYPKLRKTTVNLLEEIYVNDFHEILELGEIRSVPQNSGSSYDTPQWVIAGFRVIQKAFGTENARKAFNEFYTGDSLELPMVRYRSFLLTNRYAKADKRIRPWSSDMNCGLAKLFYAANACITGKKISVLRGMKLGIQIYEREF